MSNGGVVPDPDPHLIDPITRRRLVKFLGGASALGGGGLAYSQVSDEGEGSMNLGGFAASLTVGRTVDEFWTGPRSAFDPRDLPDNLPVWIDDGEIGVIEDGAVQRLPIGKADAPVPSMAVADFDVSIESPVDVTADRDLGVQETNDSGKTISVAAGVEVSEDIGATNSNKQGFISTEISVGGTRLARNVWDEMKLFTDGAGTVVSAVLQHAFIVPTGETYTLSILANDFASATIDTWTERAW